MSVFRILVVCMAMIALSKSILSGTGVAANCCILCWQLKNIVSLVLGSHSLSSSLRFSSRLLWLMAP